MTAISTLCVQDLSNKLKTIAAVNSAYHVYSEKELLDKTKGLPTLSTHVNTGVLYEGMKNNQSVAAKGSATSVVSTEMVVSVLVVAKPDSIYGSGKSGIAEPLDAIRNAIKRTKSPTGHPWIFQVEAPAVLNADTVVWVQRWSTACNV